ncbi:MAG: hypothetical protein A2Y38_19265 [Spirochaetes bacterium GWB1_59_5]|nr:MAG: hypothetical protein A2Y38_19265 [Spirochaetes bacterium GWB1_59_5]
MAMTAADLTARSQNIGVLEGGRGRVQQQQLADQQDALYRAQMAQNQSQFDTSLEEQRKRAAEAAAQAEQDRWFALGGSALGGLASGGMGIIGRKI